LSLTGEKQWELFNEGESSRPSIELRMEEWEMQWELSPHTPWAVKLREQFCEGMEEEEMQHMGSEPSLNRFN
jgi:hypothetical protein